MSKMSKVATRAGVAAIAVAAAASVAAGSAGAAPLPNGQKTVPAPAGWSVVLKSTGNSYSIQPSLTTPNSRRAFFSSTGSVEIKAPAGKKLDGKLGVGVIVGCQLDGRVGGGVGLSGPSAGFGIDTGTPSASLGLGGIEPSISLPMTPGATDSVTGYGRGDQIGATDSITFSKPGTYNVTIVDQNVDRDACAGYAQARVVTWVQLKGGDRLQGFLYGAPFSLG